MCRVDFDYNKSLEMKSLYTITKRGVQDLILTPASAEHTHTLIWMHGLGDSAMGFLDIFDSEISPVPPSTKVVLPTAPLRPVTLNGGMAMNAWFDILTLDTSLGAETKRYNEEHIEESSKSIQAMVTEEQEILGNDANKVFLGGFS